MIVKSRILVVDDEPSVCRSCSDILTRKDWKVETALSGNECITKTRGEHFDVVILDLKIPDIGGMELLRLIKRSHPETIIIIITGYSTVESAVETMKMGAFDYIPKPFTPEEIQTVVTRALNIKATAMVSEDGQIIHKEEVIRALERASLDDKFAAELIEQGSRALDEFDLSWEEKVAIVSGDIQWIEKHIGKLTEDQKIWLNCRLQQERW